jgi:hypothetical protein
MGQILGRLSKESGEGKPDPISHGEGPQPDHVRVWVVDQGGRGGT